MQLDIKKSVLPNGLRIATARLPGLESVAAGVWVGVGGRYESARLSGASHFIEHLLFKGTKTRSAKEISQAIEGRGGYFNAFTQEESTCYYARVSAAHGWSVFEILADMYCSPRFDSQDIDKERGVIIEEIMMYRDQPQHQVQDMLGEVMWCGHPLGRPLIGSPRTVGDMSRSEIVKFKGSKYCPANTVITLAGKLDHDECVQRIGERLGSLKKSVKPSFKRVSSDTKQKQFAVHNKDIEQCHLAVGFRIFGRGDKRKYALKLLSVLLGENMSSRLFQVVREKHGLAYSVHSSAQLYQETGVFDIQAGLDKQQSEKALRLIMKEIVRIREKPVSSRELRRAKDYAIGQLQIGLESTISQMMWLGENLLAYNRLVQPDEIIEKIENVTVEDIKKVAGYILRSRNLSISMITPGNVDRANEMMADCADML